MASVRCYAPGITFIDHDPATAGAYHSAEIPYFLRTRESLNLFRQTRIWEGVDLAGRSAGTSGSDERPAARLRALSQHAATGRS